MSKAALSGQKLSSHEKSSNDPGSELLAREEVDFSFNTVNLVARFLLEMVALAVFALWGWSSGEGGLKYVLTVSLPLIAATLWGTFAVPDDSSRSGRAPVAVPGIIRLLLELAIFILAVLALFAIQQPMIGWLFGAVVMLHYLVSFNRVLWLIRQH